MTPPLFWLALTAIVTALLWVPYILNMIVIRGLFTAMGYPGPDAKPLAPWAERAKKAHANAIESLPTFAALILVGHVGGVDPQAVTVPAIIYFVARMIHYVVYTFKVPMIRTFSFFVACGSQIYIAIQIFGKVG